MPDPSRSTPHRLVIVGAGAIGSHLAASLRPGTPRLIIDPCREVRESFAARGDETLCPTKLVRDPAINNPHPIGHGDVVVLTTCAAAATSAVANVPAEIPVICLANGLIPALSLARNGSLSHGVVEFAVHCTGPGVASRSREGWLTLQQESLGGATAWLAGTIDPDKQRVRIAADIDAHRHGKLMLNSSLDPVAAVIGGKIGDVFTLPAAFAAFRSLLQESLRVAAAAGWRLAPIQGIHPRVLSTLFGAPLLGSIAARAAGRQAAEVVSTLTRQVRRGEIGEAEHLSGAIIREGAQRGVPTPAHIRAMDVLSTIAGQARGGRPELAQQLLQR